MLHYNPQHVSSSNLLIFRRTNCIITASGIVTLCKQPYSMPVESGLSPLCKQPYSVPFERGLSPLSTGILYGCLQTVTIPEAVIIHHTKLPT